MLKDFVNLKQKFLFAIHDQIGIKWLLRLRLKFSNLNEHKFHKCHDFKDVLSPMCDCGSKTERKDFFLLFPIFAINRQKLLNDLFKIDPSLRNLKDELLLDIILYGSDKYKDTVNKEILLHTISLMPTALNGHYLTTNFLLLSFLLYFFSRKFVLKYCLLPIASFNTNYSSI